MAGPEMMELGQGRLMSNSGRSGCLIQVPVRPLPAGRNDRHTDEAELTCGLVFFPSPVGEELWHSPAVEKQGQASGESRGSGLPVAWHWITVYLPLALTQDLDALLPGPAHCPL